MNGLLVIDKPKEFTSRDVVNIVGKALNTRKVGHTGTLDPLATGVLIVAINEGLKVVNLLGNDTKEYVATVKCGVMTDTFDTTGIVLNEDNDFVLNKEEILVILKSFLGKSIQEVPIYSAVKVNGKKLYQYARNNESVILPKKEIEIFDIELIDVFDDSFTFKVLVSKGTYIRSLIRDIGVKLNIYCCMSDLRRTKVGIFDIDQSVTIDDIRNGKYVVTDIEVALSNYKKVVVDKMLESMIRSGRILDNEYGEDIVYFVNSDNKVLAIYQIYCKDNSKIKPLKVFNI